MKTAKALRIASGLLVGAAAVVGGYAVYNAERTEPVLVATHEIPPFTFLQANDFTIRSIPVSAIQSDALHATNEIVGHMTSVGILPNAQVRMAMLSSDASLQGLVDSVSQAGNVTFSLTYKPGSLESFVSPDSYVNLVTQGPNNTMLHADHVLVLKNTGYTLAPVTNAQNQNPMLILTLPESTYLPMAQNISTNNVQVLMIPQSATPNATLGQVGVDSTSSTSVSSSNSGAMGNVGATTTTTPSTVVGSQPAQTNGTGAKK